MKNTLEYVYLLNDFHADSFSNMLRHYASHQVFNSYSIQFSLTWEPPYQV